MAGRNDAAIAAALQAVAEAVGQQHNAGAGANDGVKMLETFLRNHPPTFCNIPPVSIGILPVDRARGIKFMEIKLKEIFYDMSAQADKVSATFKTRLRQRQFCNCASIGYLFGFTQKNISFILRLLSLGFGSLDLLSLPSRTHTPSSLFSPQNLVPSMSSVLLLFPHDLLNL
jgi:hypothetical protein